MHFLKIEPQRQKTLCSFSFELILSLRTHKRPEIQGVRWTVIYPFPRFGSNVKEGLLRNNIPVNATLKQNLLTLEVFYRTPWLNQIYRVFLEELSQKLKFDSELTTFFEEFFLNLKLYGYVVFRKKRYGIEVLNGSDVALQRNPQTYKIVPIFSAKLSKTRGWHLIISRMPSFNMQGVQIRCNGAGTASIDASLEILKINSNALQRHN